MRLTIRENSIRYTLSKADIQTLSKTGYIETRMEIGVGLFVYALQRSDELNPGIILDTNKLTVYMPVAWISEWMMKGRACHWQYIKLPNGNKLFLSIDSESKYYEEAIEDQPDNDDNQFPLEGVNRQDKNEIWLDFLIADFDDITPHDITALLDLQPSKIIVKGEKRRPEKEDSPVWQKNMWMFSASEDIHKPFEEHMDDLVNILEQKKELLKPLCNKYYCEFSLALFIYSDTEESTPAVHLEKRHVKLMQELNAEFDVDLYCF